MKTNLSAHSPYVFECGEEAPSFEVLWCCLLAQTPRRHEKAVIRNVFHAANDGSEADACDSSS
jgi:hypothetical protein